MHFCTGSARHASAYLSASSSGRLVRTGRSQIPATFFGHNHPRSSIPAAMETIHARYWKTSSRAGINGYRSGRFLK